MAKSVSILSACIVVAIIIFLSRRFPVIEWVEWFRIHIQMFGTFGVILFVLLFCALTLLMIPVMPLTLLAGLVYGVWGFPLVLLSATLAAGLAFLLARNFLHDYVSALMKNKPLLLAITRAVTREEWRIVILLRLSPILSFAMQNYLLAITDIRFWPYVIGSFVGMIPAIAFQVYLGSLGSFSGNGSLHWGMVIAGVAASITVLLLISFGTRHAIAEIEFENRNT